MDIELKSLTLKVTKVVRKTSAEGFSTVEPGDSLVLSLKFGHQGNSRNGCYATLVKTKVIKQGDGVVLCIHKSMSQLANILRNFELEETH